MEEIMTLTEKKIAEITDLSDLLCQQGAERIVVNPGQKIRKSISAPTGLSSTDEGKAKVDYRDSQVLQD